MTHIGIERVSFRKLYLRSRVRPLDKYSTGEKRGATVLEVGKRGVKSLSTASSGQGVLLNGTLMIWNDRIQLGDCDPADGQTASDSG